MSRYDRDDDEENEVMTTEERLAHHKLENDYRERIENVRLEHRERMSRTCNGAHERVAMVTQMIHLLITIVLVMGLVGIARMYAPH